LVDPFTSQDIMASTPFKLLRHLSRDRHRTTYRCFTARSYATTRQCSNPKSTISPPPQIKFDPSKGELHQKAAKASQLHAELNALLDAQAQRRADEKARGFFSGFSDFLRTSKSEVINIVAAFVCVILAWQVVGVQKGAKRLMNEATEKDAKIEELKAVLKVLSSEKFCTKTAQAFYNKRKEGVEQSDETSITATLFGFKKKSNDINLQDDDEKSLHIILRRELQNVIENKDLSDSEVEEKRILELQGDIHGENERLVEMDPIGKLAFGELDQMLAEVQVDPNETKSTVVKSRAGFI